MADIVAAPVAEIVVENLFSSIGRHVGYLFNYRSNILDISQQIEKLRDGRLRVQQSVDEANRQGDEIFPDVQKWLSRAEEMIQETDKFIEDEKEANRNRGCFHLKLRYQRSKKAKKQAGDIVDKIQEADNLTRRGVAHPPPPPGIGFSSISGSEVFKSRETTLNQIMEALRDDSIRMIGVWGMGGVGKTTLVQQVAKRANEEKLFDTVVMALNISQTPSVTKIQGDIASILGLKLEETNESARAVRLSQSLKKHENILIILDDIWKPIVFETIGIPYGSSYDHLMGYCKVLLTSREHDVLSNDMCTHKDFLVQHLSQEEAWTLFTKTTGDSVERTELLPIATEVVKKCEGLPVAIVTIAKALKGKSVGEWKNALVELRRSAPTNIRGVSENVFSCLELSYNHLVSKEVKSLFLLCGLLGDRDISLDDLLKYVMGLDLFDTMDSLEQVRDKVVTLVKILIASSLLLGGQYIKPSSLYFVEEEGKGYVRMHDVIRDVAKSIASRDPHRFMAKEDVSFQMDVELSNCTALSLKCTRVQKLPERLVCPKLGFFMLDSSTYDAINIPDTFFQGMKEARVVSVSQVHFTQLLSSLHLLSNLRTLCLYRCWLRLEGIAVVGELKKLQILSLVDCEMLELPEAMKQLGDLRMLSLRDCSVLIPRNVISSLSRLEHLCLRNILYRWEGREGVARGERNAWFSELKHLSCLRVLEVEIPDQFELPKDVSFGNLNRYDISIGDQRKWYRVGRNTMVTSRRFFLKRVQPVKCFSKLLKTTEVLELLSLDDIKHFVNELDYCGFLQLKYLSVNSSRSMQYIMNTTEMESVDPPPIAFPLLEEFYLKFLFNLKAVCHGPIFPIECFANLRILIIENCYSLKTILSLLPTTTQGRESVLVVFPQLQHLELNFLPNLIDFCSTGPNGNQEAPLIIPFFNHRVALPRLEFLSLRLMGNVRRMWHSQHPVGSCCKLEKLVLQNCENLQTVFPSNFLEGFQSLQFLKIDNCPSLKEIFEIDGIVVPPRKELSSCSQTQKTKSTVGINKQHPQGYIAFQNLNSLRVNTCPSLKYLFLTSVVKGLEQLEVIEISDCGVMEEIVAANEINGLDHAVLMPIFLFPRLISLRLSNLKQLKRFYMEMYTLECPLLKELKLCSCESVELLFQEKVLQDDEVDHKQPALFFVDKNTFPNMEELELLRLKGTMEIWQGQFSMETFGKLRNLEIEECHNISVVIPSSMLQALHNLERLSLRSCNSVTEVIQVDDDHEGRPLALLPQLTRMCLQDLPTLKHIFGFGFGLWPILQNLHSLEVSLCGNLINIVSPSVAKRLVQLKKLSVTNCSMVEEIVGDDYDAISNEEAARDDVCFIELGKPQLEHLVDLNNFSSPSTTNTSFEFIPSLEEMEVKKLPRLKHLYIKIKIPQPGLDHINLQKLRILQVSGCGNLEILLTLSMVKTLVQLEELIVEDCDKVKEIVLENIEGGANQAATDDDDDDEIIFTKLRILHLHRLPDLKSFSSARYTSFRFPCLTDMRVIKCPEMEYFCNGDSITQMLKGVTVDYCRSYWERDLNATIQKMFIMKTVRTHPKEEDSQEKVPNGRDAEEGGSAKQNFERKDSVEEDTKKEEFEGRIGS